MNVLDSVLSVTIVLSAVGLLLALCRALSPSSVSAVCRAGLVSGLLRPFLGLFCQHLSLPTWQVFGSSRAFATVPGGSAGIPWAVFLTSGWLLGSVLYFARITIGVIAVRRLRSGSTSPPEELQRRLASVMTSRWSGRLRVHALVVTPCVVGWRQPLLLLPTECRGWSEEHLRHATLHEVAHLERGDVWWRLIGQCVLAIWWWHPLARYLVREAHEVSEFACDQAVLRTGADPAEYVRGLLSLVSCASIPSSVPAFAARSQSALRRRVRQMLNSRPTADGSVGTLIFILVVISGVSGTAALIRLSEDRPIRSLGSPIEEVKEAIVRLDANPFPGDPDAGQ